MKKKINIRLGLISLIAIIATLIGITMVYYSLFQKKVWEDLKESARLLVETNVFQDSYPVTNQKWQNIKNFSSGNLRITWIDGDGTVLFDNDTDFNEMPNHINRPEIQLAVKNGEGESTRHSNTMNMNTFYYALLLDNGTVLRVSTQAITITRVLLTAFPVILIIITATLIGCILLGHMLTKQLMRPLELMADNLDSSGTPAYKELKPFADKIRTQHENILKAAKIRQDFTANVSHELKTPIAAISGYAELIENRLVLQDSIIQVAGSIRHNADRLYSLVTDIIKLSELDHQNLPRTFEQTDLLLEAKECVRNLRMMANKKMVTLNCSGIHAEITADKALIREMIENLVQNAIRYNKENGSVQVYVTITDSHPMISVKDTGIGIPDDQLDRIFERFYRVDKSRSRETGGTGLGLAIVKHIAEIHSAEISIQSTLGIGTEISVMF